MVHFKALYLWCCGGKRDSEDFGNRSNPELSSFPGENHSSARQDQGVSGVQVNRSIDDTSLSAVEIREKDIDLAPRLKLVTLESPVVPNGKCVRITPMGMEGSLRPKRDGFTYIGSEASDLNLMSDFPIPQDSSLGRRHLMIKYNTSTKKYYVKDLGDGSGTFVRIDIPILLKHGYIVSFGESHMVVHLNGDTSSCFLFRNNLTVKFLDGPKADQTFTYSPPLSDNKPIVIGRMADCNIKFEGNSLSRYQCSLIFVEDKGWFVTDGDGKKRSTNGTWLFVDEVFEIFNNMVFKAGQTLFQAQYEEV